MQVHNWPVKGINNVSSFLIMAFLKQLIPDTLNMTVGQLSVEMSHFTLIKKIHFSNLLTNKTQHCYTCINHKSYNFRDCDWFKRTCAALSTNRKQNKIFSRVVHVRFTAPVTCENFDFSLARCDACVCCVSLGLALRCSVEKRFKLVYSIIKQQTRLTFRVKSRGPHLRSNSSRL